MKDVFTSGDIKAMDAHEIALHNNELELIRRAGSLVAQAICSHASRRRAVFFCGSGNNGADGVAAAATLAELGWETRVYAVRLGQGEAISRLYTQYRMKSGREVLPLPSNDGIPPYDVVVDALLGTGARFGLEGDYLRAARIINRLGESGRVVAVDLPTGVSADTGRAHENAVRADLTVCLSGFKPGVILYPGAEYAGEVLAYQVIPSPLLPSRRRYLFTRSDVHSLKRSRNTHKGDYGRLAILGGSMEMPGAALLSADAALRSGAGTVTLLSDPETARVYAHRVREAMVRPVAAPQDMPALLQGKTAFVMGPGLGDGPRVYELVAEGLSAGMPTLIDADGLNALARGGPEILLSASGPLVLTPHPKELSRLLDTELRTVVEDPLAAVEEAANRFRCTVLLKGAVTLIAGAESTLFSNRGCAGMAKGGSGDVLSGVIGGFLAHGAEPQYAAAAGAYLAGVAGEAAMARYGSTAMTPYHTVECLHKAYLPYES